MRERDLPDGKELAKELDEVVKSGELLADVFIYRGIPDPEDLDPLDPKDSFSLKRRREQFAKTFLELHFDDMPITDMADEADNLRIALDDWKFSVQIGEEANGEENVQIISQLTLSFLKQCAQKELRRFSELSTTGHEADFVNNRLKLWSNALVVTNAAVGVTT